MISYDKDRLIVSQQLEIQELKEKVARHKEAKKEVHGILYSIGAPLNDNVLQFSRKQMGPLLQIAHALGLR